MFRFFFNSISISLSRRRYFASSSPDLLYFRVLSIVSKHFSKKPSKSPNSFTGLDDVLKLALSSSGKLDVNRPCKGQSVVALFNNFGFSDGQMAIIFTKYPNLLLADPDHGLKPKLDFLSQNGISCQAIVELVCLQPSILTRRLNDQIRPCFKFLMSFYNSDVRDIVSLLSSNDQILQIFSGYVVANVDTLRCQGVPDSNIAMIMSRYPGQLARNSFEFSEYVRRIKGMGFNPENMMFVHALCTVAGMPEHKWSSKVEAFESFGWSKEEFSLLFLKQPKVMDLSVERLIKALDFFMNNLEWTTTDIRNYSSLLSASFDKRIFPRFFIIKLLITNGLMKDTVSDISTAFLMPEDGFFMSFVLNHQDKIPHISDLYHRMRDNTGHRQ